jgi:hypothetical protein
LETLIHRSNVDFGKDKRLEISSTDKPPSVAIFTASSRNSFVYRPFGTLSIFTPPSWSFYLNIGVHFFQPATFIVAPHFVQKMKAGSVKVQ